MDESKQQSIAILPFARSDSRRECNWMADGLAEDIINSLSHSNRLFVFSRNSTFQFKDRPANALCAVRDLGAGFALDGDVFQGADRVRLELRLTDLAAGERAWVRRYDRPQCEIFGLIEEVALTVLQTLAPRAGRADKARICRKPPDVIDAWAVYHAGLRHLYNYNAVDNDIAKRAFGRAVAMDPNFGRPFAAMAFAKTLDILYGKTAGMRARIESALQFAYKSNGLDRREAFGRMALSRILVAAGEFAAAVMEARAAIKLNPNLVWAYYCEGHALFLGGRPRDAIPKFVAACKLSPMDPLVWLFEAMAAISHFRLGAYDRAAAVAARAAGRPNAGIWAFAALAPALAETGRLSEAHDAMCRLRDLKPDFKPADFDIYAAKPDPAFMERWTRGLRKAGLDLPHRTRHAV